MDPTPVAPEKQAYSQEIERNMVQILWGIGGMIVILGLAFALSLNRRAINPRTVLGALAIQISFGVIVLYWETGKTVLQSVSQGVQAVINSANEGIGFVFGPILPGEGEGPVFAFQVLLAGAILAPGKRTVSSALRAMGLDRQKNFHRYHRVLSHARWSSTEASRVLFGLLVEALVPEGPLVVGVDETLERRKGPKIRAKGIYRDPVRSSHSHFVKASGLRWVCVSLLAEIPWARRVWALPFLCALAHSERYAKECGKRHKPLTEWAGQLLLLVRRWCPEREIVAVADGEYASLRLLDRCRKLREPITIAGWYGGQQRVVEVLSGTALWYSTGLPAAPLRWVLIRDPHEEFETQALLCTDLDAEPERVISWFVRRWQMEATFQEVRQHLGFETQRHWAQRAIRRTAPALLSLFSLVTLFANRRMANKDVDAVRRAAWYDKSRPTFSDALALVRMELWAQQEATFCGSAQESDMVKVPREFMERLTDAVCYAA